MDEVGTLPAFPRPRLTFGQDRICPTCRGTGLTSYKPEPPWHRPASPSEVAAAKLGQGHAKPCPHCQEGLRHG